MLSLCNRSIETRYQTGQFRYPAVLRGCLNAVPSPTPQRPNKNGESGLFHRPARYILHMSQVIS